MKRLPKNSILTTAMLLTLLLTGCQLNRTDHVKRLLKHPEFEQARVAAPAFVKDALYTINDLQLENAKLRLR